MRHPPHGLARAFRSSLLGLCALVACLAAGGGAAVPAFAQTAEMNLPALTQDRGLRTGEFTLHPSIGVMGHHDTNVFNGNDKEVGNPPKGATSVRILPRLSLLNDGTGNVNFSFTGNGDIRICV